MWTHFSKGRNRYRMTITVRWVLQYYIFTLFIDQNVSSETVTLFIFFDWSVWHIRMSANTALILSWRSIVFNKLLTVYKPRQLFFGTNLLDPQIRYCLWRLDGKRTWEASCCKLILNFGQYHYYFCFFPLLLPVIFSLFLISIYSIRLTTGFVPSCYPSQKTFKNLFFCTLGSTGVKWWGATECTSCAILLFVIVVGGAFSHLYLIIFG